MPKGEYRRTKHDKEEDRRNLKKAREALKKAREHLAKVGRRKR